MNVFRKISKEEYDKTIYSEFSPKKGILDYLAYDELIIPRRATKGSAGYDFFSPISFFLKPGETMKVPTGIKCQLDNKNVLMLFPRSSYGFKYRMQLDNTVGIVDSDYFDNIDNEGHIFIKITNDTKNDKTITIKKGDAFAQGIILPFETAYEDEITIERVGGIGSTSKN